jgi:hypothetical protein
MRHGVVLWGCALPRGARTERHAVYFATPLARCAHARPPRSLLSRRVGEIKSLGHALGHRVHVGLASERHSRAAAAMLRSHWSKRPRSAVTSASGSSAITWLITHHETFRTTIQPPYSSTKELYNDTPRQPSHGAQRLAARSARRHSDAAPFPPTGTLSCGCS